MSERAQRDRTEERFVRSDDPSLTPEANRLLTEEVREVVGRDRVRVPVDTPRRSERPHGKYPPAISNLIANRQVLIVTLLGALTVGGILSLVTHSWWGVVIASVVHALGTMLVAGGVIQLTTQIEHMSPDVAARLEEEGVGDPDRVLTELVEDFRGARTASGTAQVVSGGYNEQTVEPPADPATAAVEQRTVLSPSSSPSAPAGSRSAVAALPWWVVIGMIVLSLAVGAIRGGIMWVVPALIVPIGLAWVVLQRRLDARGEEEAGVKRRHEAQGARYPADDAATPAVRRLLPITAIVVLGVAVFMILMGVVAGLL